MIRAVVGIICQEQKILLAERPAHQTYSGFWEFPGGKIELNESELVALKRELSEEIGIEVISADYLFSHQHDYPDKQVNLAIWQVRTFSGIPYSKEGQKLCWADPKTMLSLNLIEGNRNIVQRILSSLF